ncbi:hypothetical protein V1507DRAFT_467215 [Lipomyces tetrasporus]
MYAMPMSTLRAKRETQVRDQRKRTARACDSCYKKRSPTFRSATGASITIFPVHSPDLSDPAGKRDLIPLSMLVLGSNPRHAGDTHTRIDS